MYLFSTHLTNKLFLGLLNNFDDFQVKISKKQLGRK